MSLLILMLLLPERLALAREAGEVVSVLGTVEVRREGRWRPVGPGAVLAAGETVKTGADSRAAILLANGTQLKLNAHSQLELRQTTPRPVGFTPAAVQAVLQNFLALWELPGDKFFLKTACYKESVIFYVSINHGRCP